MKMETKAGNKERRHKKEAAAFMPLEGGSGLELPKQKPSEEYSKVLYTGRIPHGFYEKEMDGFFSQFGAIQILRAAWNKKTGKSKRHGFIEFVDHGVANIVANSVNNYLLYEHLLQVHLVPLERVHLKL